MNTKCWPTILTQVDDATYDDLIIHVHSKMLGQPYLLTLRSVQPKHHTRRSLPYRILPVIDNCLHFHPAPV